MTNTRKNEIIDNIMSLLIQLTDDETTAITEAVSKPVEMLTVKECTEAVKGLKENTVRSLVAQGKVKYIRTGQGKRGKILINKEDLLRVFEA
ncbi:MAG: helix-turn-helix domain-containing protein [Ruminococcus sp.]|nr:helix-turn-helix domain-containing protein [Ruminococcus sp.]